MFQSTNQIWFVDIVRLSMNFSGDHQINPPCCQLGGLHLKAGCGDDRITMNGCFPMILAREIMNM